MRPSAARVLAAVCILCIFSEAMVLNAGEEGAGSDPDQAPAEDEQATQYWIRVHGTIIHRMGGNAARCADWPVQTPCKHQQQLLWQQHRWRWH